MESLIGHGEWTVQIVGQGGSPLLYEVPWASLNITWQLNASGTLRMVLATEGETWSECAEILRVTDTYEHEVIAWRDRELAFAGPVYYSSSKAREIHARDLSHWMDVRFLDDLHSIGDSADVFRAVFENAYNKDTRPNIQLNARQSGIDTGIDVREIEFRRASDALQSLSNYGIDWTVVGRTILAGGQEVFEGGGVPLLFHDDGVIEPDLQKEGANLATDLVLFGGREDLRSEPIIGRATAGTDRYGLVQRSVTDLLVVETTAADSGALSRVQAMQPTPRRLVTGISDGAAYGFFDLVPGRRGDVRLYESPECGDIEGIMRVQEKSVQVGDNELVSASLIPQGVGEDSV